MIVRVAWCTRGVPSAGSDLDNCYDRQHGLVRFLKPEILEVLYVFCHEGVRDNS